MAVITGEGVVAERGAGDVVLRWASVTKLVTAYAALIAAEEGVLDLDEPAGPPGSTVRHLLAHASGLPFEGDAPIAKPGERRIYSNSGFDLVGERLAERAEMPFAEYLQAAVLDPLGLAGAELRGRPSEGMWGSPADLARFGRELLAPTLVAPETLAEATEVAFPGLVGVLPGLGRQEPNDWGLGFELKDAKRPHWTGTDKLAPHVRPLRRRRDVPLGRPGCRRRLRLPHRPGVRRVGAGRLAAARGRGAGRARARLRRLCSGACPRSAMPSGLPLSCRAAPRRPIGVERGGRSSAVGGQAPAASSARPRAGGLPRTGRGSRRDASRPACDLLVGGAVAGCDRRRCHRPHAAGGAIPRTQDSVRAVEEAAEDDGELLGRRRALRRRRARAAPSRGQGSSASRRAARRARRRGPARGRSPPRVSRVRPDCSTRPDRSCHSRLDPMATSEQLAEWRMCPRCQTPLEHADASVCCPSCGLQEYGNPAPTVSALVRDAEGRILLGRRALEPGAGLWDLLGGFMDVGEEPLDTLRRELREETGLEIEPASSSAGSPTGTARTGSGRVNFYWEARLGPGELRARGRRRRARLVPGRRASAPGGVRVRQHGRAARASGRDLRGLGPGPGREEPRRARLLRNRWAGRGKSTSQMTTRPSGRAARPSASSSVAPVASGYERSLRPCLGTTIAPRRRGLILTRALRPRPRARAIARASASAGRRRRLRPARRS